MSNKERIARMEPILRKLIRADNIQDREAWGEDEVHPDALRLIVESVAMARKYFEKPYEKSI